MQKIQKFIIFILRLIFGKGREQKSVQTEVEHIQEVAVEKPEDNTTGQSLKKKFVIVLIGVLVLGGLVVGYVDLAHEKTAQLFGGEIGEETVAREEFLKELKQVLGQVERHMLVLSLEEEEPLLATVLDATALAQEQPFYSGVTDGDKVLIYTQSLRAIIYSPKRDILVNVGPVQFSPQIPSTGSGQVPQNDAAITGQAPQAVRTLSSEQNEGTETLLREESTASAQMLVLTLDIRNGSGENGVAGALATELGEQEAYSVLSVADASSNTYQKTLVVDQTDGENNALVIALAEKLNAAIVTMVPPGEVASEAGAIIILGQEED